MEHSVQRFLFPYTKIRPVHYKVSGGAKNGFVFDCGKIPAGQVLCSRRSKVSASRPYAPDTRGVCFQGPSRALWYLISRCVLRTEQSTAREVKSDRTRMANAVLQHITCMDGCVSPLRTAALRSNRRYGAAALLHCGAKVPQISASKAQKNAYLYRSTRRVRCS